MNNQAMKVSILNLPSSENLENVCLCKSDKRWFSEYIGQKLHR